MRKNNDITIDYFEFGDCGYKTKCWLWRGFTNKDGYGMVWHDSKSMHVHKVMFEMHKHKVTNNLHIDHLCKTRHCGNPEHLELVPLGENTRRGKLTKLTRNNVEDIKLCLLVGFDRKVIAKQFDISLQRICDINKNRV